MVCFFNSYNSEGRKDRQLALVKDSHVGEGRKDRGGRKDGGRKAGHTHQDE